MSASTSHKHHFKTGHLAENTILLARKHALNAGRHTQTLNPAYPTPYRYGTMPFYPFYIIITSLTGILRSRP